MKKLFITISLSTILFTAFSQTKLPEQLQPMTASDHLEEFTNRQNAALVVAGLSILLASVPLFSGYAPEKAMRVYTIAGLGMGISLAFNISAIQQIGKAGRKLEKF